MLHWKRKLSYLIPAAVIALSAFMGEFGIFW